MRKLRRSIAIFIAINTVFSLLVGYFSAIYIRQNQLHDALSGIVRATQLESSAFNVDTYSRIVFSMLQAFAAPLGEKAINSAHVVFCQDGKVISEVPRLTETKTTCLNEQSNFSSKVSSLIPLESFSDQVAIKAEFFTSTLDPLFGFIALALFLLIALIAYPKFRLQIEVHRFESILSYLDNLIIGHPLTSHRPTITKAAKTLESKIIEFKERLSTYQEKLAKMQTSVAISEIAMQVAHDIRSPLAALDILSRKHSKFASAEEQKITQAAISRLKEIAENLLQTNKLSSDPRASEQNTDTQPVEDLVGQIISEKKIQHGGLKFEFNFQPLDKFLAQVQPDIFKRIISNLINNSIEASCTTIFISLTKIEARIHLSIKDDGIGIPPEILVNLGKQGKTFGKSAGNGLGLYHAKKSVESWSGSLTIHSQVNLGTEIRITLPSS